MDYSVNELAAVLKNMYENTYSKEKALMIHVFGIKYGEIIRDKKVRIADIIKYAGLKKSYVTELNKGVNLSKYVEIKSDIMF